MSRLFVSTFFRMLKKIVFWILLICMFVYGVYSASNAASEANGRLTDAFLILHRLWVLWQRSLQACSLVLNTVTVRFGISWWSDIPGCGFIWRILSCVRCADFFGLHNRGICGRQRQRRGTAYKNKCSYHVSGMQHFGFRCLYKHYDDACDIEYKQSRKCSR